MKQSAAEQRDPEHRRFDQSDRIQGLIHCVQCLHEIAEIVGYDSGRSVSYFQEVEVGLTDVGIQVWCVRHDCNMYHLDFEGMFHPLVIEEAA